MLRQITPEEDVAALYVGADGFEASLFEVLAKDRHLRYAVLPAGHDTAEEDDLFLLHREWSEYRLLVNLLGRAKVLYLDE